MILPRAIRLRPGTKVLASHLGLIRYDVAADELVYMRRPFHLMARWLYAAKVAIGYKLPRRLGLRMPWMAR